MNHSKTAAELAAHVNGQLTGAGDTPIERVADLENAVAGEIAYVDSEKFFDLASNSKASCLLVPEGVAAKLGQNHPATIEVAHPKLAFSLIAEILHPPLRREPAGR